MQSCSYPILKTMQKFPQIKWVFSCWGNDLFYYQNIKIHRLQIIKVLQRVNYLHTDCERDYKLAKKLGFSGEYLGVIPGGTGYKIKELEIYKKPFEERKIILIKGYEHLFGRSLNVIRAIEMMKEELQSFEIVVFGAHDTVQNYVEDKKLGYKVYGRHDLSHLQLLQLMGQSLVYVGNSISDGMPNTLLEAIVMGAFPIQSNPGGATAEIIKDGKNGFLINDPSDIEDIKFLIQSSLTNLNLLQKAKNLNSSIANDKLEYTLNRNKIIELYYKVLIN
jgi:glycosyltransferase involved in cell wall biosynthesis